MLGPCFIASDDSLQEGLSYFVRPIKEFPGNVKAGLLFLRREHLRYPATAHFQKFEHFSDHLYLWMCPAAGLFLQKLSSFSKNQVVYYLLFFRCVPL